MVATVVTWSRPRRACRVVSSHEHTFSRIGQERRKVYDGSGLISLKPHRSQSKHGILMLHRGMKNILRRRQTVRG